MALTPTLIAVDDIQAGAALYWILDSKAYCDKSGRPLVRVFNPKTDKETSVAKIVAKEPDSGYDVDGYDIPAGRFAVCDKGRYWYRTEETLACLSDSGLSYSGPYRNQTVKVRVLPTGTVITITL